MVLLCNTPGEDQDGPHPEGGHRNNFIK